MHTGAVKAWGAGAALIGGPLLLIGHLLSVGDSGDYGTVAGTSARFIAHTVLILGFMAIYLLQRAKSGSLNHLGMIPSVLGTSAISAVLFVETAGAAGENVGPILESTVPAMFVAVGAMGWFVGVILFSIAIIRAGVFNPVSGWLLLIGNITFGVGTVAGSAEQVLIIAGSAMTAAALTWFGMTMLMAMLREREVVPATAI